jgi:hypothetical protein
MADADMAESIHHPLVSEDAARSYKLFDYDRVDRPSRSRLRPRWLVCEGNRKRRDD